MASATHDSWIPVDPPLGGARSPWRPGRALMTAAKLVLLAAMIAWMASVIRKENLAAAAGRISWAWAAAALPLMAWEAWAQAAKHRAILAASGEAPSVGSLILLNLRIGAVSQFLPGEIFGAGARLALMRRHVSLDRCFSMMVFDRFTQLTATFGFGVLACLWVPQGRPLLPAAVIGLLLLLAAPALAWRAGLPAWLLRPLPAAWGRRVRGFAENLRGNLRIHLQLPLRNPLRGGLRGRSTSGMGWIRIPGLTAALQVQRALLLWTLSFAVGMHVGLPVVILFLTALILAQHAALSFGGLGVREATAVGFFGMFGTAPEQALLLGLLVSSLQLVRAGLGGLLLIGSAGSVGSQPGAESPGGEREGERERERERVMAEGSAVEDGPVPMPGPGDPAA